MKRKLRITWIDDNPERKGSAVVMERELNAKVDFVDVKDVDLDDVLDALTKKSEPDVVIVDHNLEGESGIFKKGSTVATYLRENWYECPMICVSGVDVNQVDSQQRNLYEAFYSIQEISDHFTEIKIIALAYNNLKDNRPTTIDELLEILGTPEDDRIKLASIIPTQIKENFEDTSLLVEMSKWINSTLLSRPGFLYDDLHAATFLGLNIDGFEKIKKKFKSAKYTGPFANPEVDRWWKTTLLAILNEVTDVRGLPWEKGRKLKGIDQNDYSKCYSSEEPFPEVIAFIDQTRSAQQQPMKQKYTTIHPDYESLLYFDEIRLMKPAE